MAYASWGKRAGGYLIDLLILAPLYLLLIIFGTSKATIDPQTFQVSGGGYNAFGYILVLAIAGVAIYNRWVQGGNTGQTWGRKAMGIKVVSEETGQPLGIAMAFVRDLAHIVDSIICYVGWLFPLWDAKKQTIADKLLKSVAVSA